MRLLISEQLNFFIGIYLANLKNERFKFMKMANDKPEKRTLQGYSDMGITEIPIFK